MCVPGSLRKSEANKSVGQLNLYLQPFLNSADKTEKKQTFQSRRLSLYAIHTKKRLMLFMNISLLMSTYEYRHVKRSKLKHCFGSAFLTISFFPLLCLSTHLIHALFLYLVSTPPSCLMQSSLGSVLYTRLRTLRIGFMSFHQHVLVNSIMRYGGIRYRSI